MPKSMSVTVPAVNEYIAGFDVAVNHVVFMDVREGIAQG